MKHLTFVVGLFVLALAAFALPVRAAPDAEFSCWNQALETLAKNGFSRVEDVELDLFGRFRVDAPDADRIDHELKLSGDGTRVLDRKRDGSIDEPADILPIEALRSALHWLRSRGYHDLEQLSVDDGLIEIDARDASRRRVELTLNPQDMQIVALDARRFIDWD